MFVQQFIKSMIKRKAVNVAYKLWNFYTFFSLKFSSISAYIVLISL